MYVKDYQSRQELSTAEVLRRLDQDELEVYAGTYVFDEDTLWNYIDEIQKHQGLMFKKAKLDLNESYLISNQHDLPTTTILNLRKL